MEDIKKPVPYIEEKEGVFEVTFIEPGTSLSTYEFSKLRDANICANEVKPLVEKAAEEGLIDPSMISHEEFIVEPLVTEVVDEYGFKTVTTEYYKGETVVEIFNKDGVKVTAEQRQDYIDVIEEERRKEAEREAQKLPAQVDYTAVMTDTLLPSEVEGEI